MALNAQGYFNCLKSYLNINHYGEVQANNGEVVLKERIFGRSGNKAVEYKVSLRTTGETLVIKLDAKKMVLRYHCSISWTIQPNLGQSVAIS